MQPFYDPKKTYDENYERGPFGAFADGAIWRCKTPAQYSFLGHFVDIPFGIPAGPLLNSTFIKSAFEKGFSVCVYKTVRSTEKPVNGFPNVVPVTVTKNLTLAQARKGVVVTDTYKDPLSITNSFGVPSKSPEIWQEDMKRALSYARRGQVLIGSFQGTTGDGGANDFIADCVHTAQLVAQTGVSILEMNTSCPNEGTSHLLCFDIDRVETIVKKIRKHVQLPLLLKIAYFEDQNLLEEFVKRIGPLVDGIATINTIPAKVLNQDGSQGLPGTGRAISGICGDSIRWAGLSMVGRIKKLRRTNGLKFSIIGVGGVTKPEHVSLYRKKGADIVMSATGAMWDPYLAQKVYTSLER